MHAMSRTLTISDEFYARLESEARDRGLKSVEELLDRLQSGEPLSAVEHDRWMKTKIEAGWQWAPEIDEAKKLHKDLLPWQELDNKQRARPMHAETDIARRKDIVRQIDHLRESLFARYGEMADSAELLREDRAR
jgi:RyR domain-containing protein